ncbi:MAG: sn-glycerol-3-phosphate ABC transporter ATP-binding protein UgpC [Rhodobacteraceae bacterium]|nr:sn-glycerol-3-phosphate ABC transporter ATP-binding protein UgpC [Paracoccaceae bacterium]
MSGISIEHLNKSYASVAVLRDVNLQVEDGEFLVLLGPSGCGKSTLLNAIAGLEEINSGAIRINGADVSALEPSQRGIAMVFQSYALYPTMSVYRNMAFGLKIAGLPKTEVEQRVAWAAKLLQLDHLLDRKPAALSGGQRQRVAIGRALVRRAAVYLFDEPLSNLDAKLRTETRIELKKLHSELASTIVYVTHDQVEAMTLASRIAVMNGGVIEQCADPTTIYDTPATLFVAGFVGSPAMNLFHGRLVSEGGQRFADIGHARVSLDRYRFSGEAADQRIVLGIRPESIALAVEGAEAFEAEVRFVEPLGADTLCWFDLGGASYCARMTPAAARGVAGRRRLGIDLDRLSVFAEATGFRL